ncbi:hypothetical protein IC582_006507 [Cucumis melo]
MREASFTEGATDFWAKLSIWKVFYLYFCPTQLLLAKCSCCLTCFPMLKGMYLYLIMCMIWRFIVRTNRTIQ